MEKSLLGLKRGMRVEHNLLGKGMVREIEPYNSFAVLVEFDDYKGNSQWMLDGTLAKIEEQRT